jgi:hypothetical protein
MKKVDPADKVEAAQPAGHATITDFRSLLGIGTKAPLNPNPKLTNEDQLWEEDVD